MHEHAQVLDTLLLAREKYPGQKNSLDALCKRLSVDNSHRELHGALLDAQLLADVYLAMTGGQGDLGFGGADVVVRARLPGRRPRGRYCSYAVRMRRNIAAHAARWPAWTRPAEGTSSGGATITKVSRLRYDRDLRVARST